MAEINPIELTKQLVQIRSISGQETEIINFIKKLLAKWAIPVSTIKNGGLAIKVKGENSQDALIFNAHLDTVPEGNSNNWTYPPYGHKAAEVAGNKIYGLGASDMKAGIASLLTALNWMLANKPKCDVWFSFVVREEIDGSGTKNFVKWFKQNHSSSYQTAQAIVCEPTNLTQIDLGHRGNCFIKLIIKGDAGHGSKPHLIKRNAALYAAEIAQRIEKQKDAVLKKYDNNKETPSSIGITSINAGTLDAPNRFSDTATIGLDFRFSPNLRKDPKYILNKILEGYKYTYEEITEFDLTNAPFTTRNERVVQALSTAANIANFGMKLSSCDMATFTKNGIHTCIFGPGNPHVIHKPDEYCEVSQIEKAAEIYIQTADNFAAS